ncbi:MULTISPECIES: GIY-YIG nuclease family protein [unclassified Cyanobium]|uniref:GIY-YIG nuclease family protein n=1 Tax=unclassified Cyanobium TaxID=2627006 RepID=UPI0020CF71C2|nr:MULTISPECIES: GIY-YIG nuclease family protein [unclassified Cyanobium]MCP9833450.1 GIY-YIG nuclease family protein [Cyanobium sp. La Preciosa 7G6]MCP9936215.1 GIY-YIG nuclease family protein [Cyanobium sp. Aljojuca 7A6]
MSRQGELFTAAVGAGGASLSRELPLLRQQLLAWQGRLAAHQGPLYAEAAPAGATPLLQGQLFPVAADPGDPQALSRHFDPLSLSPQSLSFWRWPRLPQRGAAVYLVMDRPPQLPAPLLLYVGETGRADQRWKGDHDCKGYLAAYGEALARVGLEARPSIRFWWDVPAAVSPRRALEQALIRRWLPPFNKETRERWATPFTADSG